MSQVIDAIKQPFISRTAAAKDVDRAPSSVDALDPASDISAAAPQTGEQALSENTSGGLGRHLGLFSTTFLM